MKNVESFLNEGEKYIKGLHQAKVGDHINIGIEGQRNKEYSKIAKILDSDKLVDTNGNIFGRNGVIIRRKGGWAKYIGKGKIVSAQIITQKQFDDSYRELLINHIQKYIRKEDIETVKNIIDLMKVKIANNRLTSRFD